MLCIVTACPPSCGHDTGRDPSPVMLQEVSCDLKSLIENEGEGHDGKKMNRFHLCGCGAWHVILSEQRSQQGHMTLICSRCHDWLSMSFLDS